MDTDLDLLCWIVTRDYPQVFQGFTGVRMNFFKIMSMEKDQFDNKVFVFFRHVFCLPAQIQQAFN